MQQHVDFCNEHVSQLTVGDWVIFQGNKDDSNEPIWLGWVMSTTEWGGQCVCRNKTRKSGNIQAGSQGGQK